MRLRAELAVARAALDDFTAVYHRPSGATHLLVEPAPQILAALGNETLTPEDLLTRLSTEYEVEGAREALAARVDELIATGLIVAA